MYKPDNSEMILLEKLTVTQSALFNFQSALMVLLLLICTSAYCHQLFPAYMDRRKDSYVKILLL
jgi:Protein of unknown function (DUF1242)